MKKLMNIYAKLKNLLKLETNNVKCYKSEIYN